MVAAAAGGGRALPGDGAAARADSGTVRWVRSVVMPVGKYSILLAAYLGMVS